MSGLLIPSYAQGFARNAAESENPGLWKGLVCKWAPSLGVTGLTLRDQSGHHNHGTLTGMDPAVDWVGSSMGVALDNFSETAYVATGFFPSGVHRTLMFWGATPNRSTEQWIGAHDASDHRF